MCLSPKPQVEFAPGDLKQLTTAHKVLSSTRLKWLHGVSPLTTHCVLRIRTQITYLRSLYALFLMLGPGLTHLLFVAQNESVQRRIHRISTNLAARFIVLEPYSFPCAYE